MSQNQKNGATMSSKAPAATAQRTSSIDLATRGVKDGRQLNAYFSALLGDVHNEVVTDRRCNTGVRIGMGMIAVEDANVRHGGKVVFVPDEEPVQETEAVSSPSAATPVSPSKVAHAKLVREATKAKRKAELLAELAAIEDDSEV